VKGATAVRNVYKLTRKLATATGRHTFFPVSAERVPFEDPQGWDHERLFAQK
jgi:hypothetical protein